MKIIILISGIILVLIIAAAGFFVWGFIQKFLAMEIIRVDPQLTLYIGGGGNSFVLTSEDGSQALVVDTKMGEGSKKLRETVKAGDITIVNTHCHPDHIGGNSLYPAAKIIAGSYTKEQWGINKDNRYPYITIKPGEEKVIKIGGETAHIRNMGQAHSWDDVVVYCEKRKLLAAGDIVVINMHPVIVPQGGANISAWTAALDKLYKTYDIKTLLPGHGGVSDRTALLTMKDYFDSIGAAAGNPAQLQELRRKCKDYLSFPFFANFDRTVEIIKSEKK